MIFLFLTPRSYHSVVDFLQRYACNPHSTSPNLSVLCHYHGLQVLEMLPIGTALDKQIYLAWCQYLPAAACKQVIQWLCFATRLLQLSKLVLLKMDSGGELINCCFNCTRASEWSWMHWRITQRPMKLWRECEVSLLVAVMWQKTTNQNHLKDQIRMAVDSVAAVQW